MHKKIALINGAYGGIGQAIVESLAKAGFNCILLGRNEEKLRDITNKLSIKFPNCEFSPIILDISNQISVESLPKKILELSQYVDVLVNAVGIVPVGSLLELSDMDWQNAIDICLIGVIRLIKQVLPLISQNAHGRIILINGVLAPQPDPSLLISSVITGAIRNLTKALSKDISKRKITVNAIHPGATKTKLWEDLADTIGSKINMTGHQLTAQVASGNPLGRLAEPEDIANIVDFLCSENSDYINGAFINVDGGNTNGV